MLHWDFAASTLGFRYLDDLFRDTDQPLHAVGRLSGGALFLDLGAKGKARDISGGWSKSFEIETEAEVTLSFRYRVDMHGAHKKKHFADVLATLDGETLGTGGADFVDRLYGAKGKSPTTTGWQTVEIDLGTLEAGAHELEIGGYLSHKKKKKGGVEFQFDDVTIETDADNAPAPPALGAFEEDVIRFTNDFRAGNGLAPLRADAALSAAAEDWSREMAQGDFFRHSDGGPRIAAYGYAASGWGENIAAGQTTPRDVVDAWIASPGHRANLLRADFADIGVGHFALDPDGGAAPYGHYWTQVFGAPDTLL